MSAQGLAQLRGASITFSINAPTSYDATTDRGTGTTATDVPGHAIETEPDWARYESLKLTRESARELMFVPSTAGQVPREDMSCSWGGTTYTVRAVKAITQNGTALRARVLIGI